jgi:hypothetical protein
LDAAEAPRLSPDAEATPSASALRVPVLREAQDIRGSVVAVDVAVVGEHLEATVSARLQGVRKPRLQNILFVATGQGRRPPLTRREVLATLEEEAPYPTRRSGMIRFGGSQERVAKGTLVREHFAFALPEELRDGGNYELWVDVDESQSGGHPWRFKFELDRLPEAVRTARGSM